MRDEIDKSTRHARIVGIFGEYVVCNWLSRSAFEVSVVDHTGMDIIAYDPRTKRRPGITVKSRTRTKGKEHEEVFIFSRSNHDRQKLMSAFKAFKYDPWMAAGVECGRDADLCLTTLDHCDSKHKTKNRDTDAWRMGERVKEQYALDPEVSHIHLTFQHNKYWPPLRGNRN